MMLNNKTYLVTGASGTIGQAITDFLLEEGAAVIGIYNKAISLLQHEKLTWIQCDLNDLDLVESTIKTLKKQYPIINGIILAAGYGKFCEIEQFSKTQMQSLMNVNFLSQALLVKILLANLKSANQGKLIAIASESSLQGARKGSMYCASKFALRGFLQSLRAEVATKELAVSIINPGLVAGEFFSELDFSPGTDYYNQILPKQIVNIIAMLLEMENNCVVEEVNCQPLKKVIKKNNEQKNKTI